MTDGNRTTEGLSPCPFCGAATAPKVERDWLDDFYACFSVTCNAKAGGCGISLSRESKQESIEAWNRRSPGACADHSDVLRAIGDKAHDLSTGPAVPDGYWELREMAYDALRTAPEPGGRQIDEGKLWSFLRDCINQGTYIQMDVANGQYLTTDALHAHLDHCARERVEQFAARCYATTKSGDGQ